MDKIEILSIGNFINLVVRTNSNIVFAKFETHSSADSMAMTDDAFGNCFVLQYHILQALIYWIRSDSHDLVHLVILSG